MADIRQSTAVLDDFNRADESTLAGPNWVLADSGTTWQSELALFNNYVTEGASVNRSASAWNPLALNGDDAEAWAHGVGGNQPGIAWDICLGANIGGSGAIDGYRFRVAVSTSGVATQLQRIDNGSFTTLLTAGAVNPGWTLIRRNGTSVEGWVNTVGGSTANWTLAVSAVDNTYTTGLHPVLAISENAGSQATGWDDFGAGPQELVRTQIYRYVSN